MGRRAARRRRGRAVFVLLLLGLLGGLGRGGVIGAVAPAVLIVVWEMPWLSSRWAPADLWARLGAVLALFSVVLLGLLPGLALTASGLTGLDDTRAGGVSVSRYEVGTRSRPPTAAWRSRPCDRRLGAAAGCSPWRAR